MQEEVACTRKQLQHVALYFTMQYNAVQFMHCRLIAHQCPNVATQCVNPRVTKDYINRQCKTTFIVHARRSSMYAKTAATRCIVFYNAVQCSTIYALHINSSSMP